MFRPNCHHQGTNTYVTKSYSNKIHLQCLRISHVQIIRKTDPVTGPGVAQRVGTGIALLFHDRGTRRG